MGNKNSKTPVWLKSMTIIIVVLSLIIIGTLVFLSAEAPVQVSKMWQEELKTKVEKPVVQPKKKKSSKVKIEPESEEAKVLIEEPEEGVSKEMRDIKLKEAYLLSQLTSARGDSAYLNIDMREQVLTLNIKGVEVHRVKFSEYKMSKFFNSLPFSTLYSYLSNPIIFSNYEATITKEKLVEKIAPKNEDEAEEFVMPDTSKVDPVYVTMVGKLGFEIELKQSELPASEKEKELIEAFDKKENKENITQILNCVKKFEALPFTPKLTLYVPKRDGEIIYKAIPYRVSVNLLLK